MKVLVLATDIFTRGGIARYTSTLSAALGRILGPENVDVLCFFDWGYSGQKPSEFNVIGMASQRQRAGSRSRLEFLFRAVWAGIRGYDLVIANHVALAPVAALMKLMFGTPYWVACHSVEVWWGTTAWREAALKRANLILPVSDYTAGVLRNAPGIDQNRLKVLYNAIPDSFARLLTSQEPISGLAAELKRQDPLLLSVCTLVRGNEFKGVDTVIRALPRVLRAHPALRYVVVGDGEIRGALEKLAAKAGVTGNVTFTGEISDAALAEFYRACDAFVLPSRGQQCRGKTGGEGFGRVYAEAAFAGKAVVGSLCGGAAEAVIGGTTGFAVDPESDDEIAEALITLLSDPQLASRMGAAGRTRALATFSEDALSDALIETLRPYGLRDDGVPELAQAGGRL